MSNTNTCCNIFPIKIFALLQSGRWSLFIYITFSYCTIILQMPSIAGKKELFRKTVEPKNQGAMELDTRKDVQLEPCIGPPFPVSIYVTG